ncbi:hypothetical protein H4S02_001530 [Coemansia sp. RSA 2611]|nr:hypothetical protein H4S02_001530 [Coemansia sp. RSA 2611]
MSMIITELPHKEQALFRSALKLYETRQYKKGLKISDQILKKFPNHGETLAVKGMFLTHLDRKDEGYEMIERGLKINPQSVIGWQVYGIVCRNDQKLAQAVKCYEEALKANMDNMQVLRELGTLLMQEGQFARVAEVRERMVRLNPTFPPSWMGLAVAHHMNGRYDLALKAISTHEPGPSDPALDKYQTSELLLYKNWLLELNGEYQRALDHLKEIRPQITDVTAWKEQKAKLLLKVDRKEAAATAYQDLIERNAENDEYIVGYLACNGLDIKRAEDQDAAIEVIDSLRQQFPTSNRLRFLPLTFSSGDNFVNAAKTLVKYALRKGIPSLFSSTKVLYADAAKGAALGKLVEGFAAQLRDTKRLCDSTDDEPASVLMWCNHYLAQHYDYYGGHERALVIIEEAIRSSPSTVEPYMVKAKILKHAGDLQAARDTMDYARQLDLKDRYINAKCVKYMLRNNEVDEAEKTFIMFVSDDSPHKVQDIVNFQGIWYLCERAHAFRRLGDIGRALKHYHEVISTFDTYRLDQLDFHAYSVRKATLRSYVGILQWESTVYNHPIYRDAAQAAIECYMELVDRKAAGKPFVPIVHQTDAKPLTRNGSSQQGQHNLSAGIGEAKVFDVDKDPNGAGFVDSDNLASALKLAEQLESGASASPATHVTAFEVHMRMHKYFLALKTINALKAIDAEHPALPSMVVRLTQALDTDESFAAPLKAPLKAQIAKAFGEVSAATSAERSLEAMLAVTRGMLALGGNNVAQARALLMQAPEDKYASGCMLEQLLDARRLLVQSGATEDELAAFGTGAKKAFPLATCF